MHLSWKPTSAGALKKPLKLGSRGPYAGIASATIGGGRFAIIFIEVSASAFRLGVHSCGSMSLGSEGQIARSLREAAIGSA
jgi:hypothetical protein